MAGGGGSLAHRLPDLLAPGLRLIFIGTAAGHRSAALRQYYAGYGNRFWPTLHAVGLTPERFTPADYPRLLALGIGLTDMHKTGVGGDAGLDPGGFDAMRAVGVLRPLHPGVIAFTGKKAASIWLGLPTGMLAYGRRSDPHAVATQLFVLPSPSGQAVKHWSMAPWQELAVLVSDNG
jgi:TDG/mug DNA glycosylase family protein